MFLMFGGDADDGVDLADVRVSGDTSVWMVFSPELLASVLEGARAHARGLSHARAPG